MFIGEYNHTLDAKGRVSVPARLKEELGESFIMTRNLDGCLSLYDQARWSRLEEKLQSLPFTDSRSRRLKRFLLGGAMLCIPDKQGRILIPASLRETAGIQKEVLFIGVGDYVELWSSERWNERDEFGDVQELGSDMEGLGI